MKPRELVDLIHHLDAGVDADSYHDQAGIEYVEVRRYNHDASEHNEQDAAATALIRALLREKLGTFPLDEIGAAVLARIDEGAST